MTKIKKINPFFLNYVGGKYRESIDCFHNDDIDFNKYSTFVEPFGGSFGFSRFIYLKLDKPTDKKFIIYDNNEELITFYNNVKAMTYEELEKLHNDYNDIMNRYSKEEWSKDGRKIIKCIAPTITDKNISFMFINNMSTTQKYSKKAIKKFNVDWFEMLKYCEFICLNVNSNHVDIMNKHNDKKTLIYLDPPYLNSCNTFYNDVEEDYSEMLIKHFVGKYKFRVIFVHEKNYLLRYILNKYIYKSIHKVFQFNKRITTQDIYMN